MYCGNEIVVREALRSASGPDPENMLKLAKSALESGNNKEAIQYANRYLEHNSENVEAWFIKGEAAGWSSSLGSFRLAEMISHFQQGLECANSEEKNALKEEAARKINNLSTALYNRSKEHYNEFRSLEDSWGEYLQRCAVLIKALEMAHELLPENKEIIENIIHLCADNIGGAIGEYRDGPVIREYEQEITGEYEKELREKRKKFVDKAKALDPSYQPPEIEKKKVEDNSCFVATATMGDVHHPMVVELRRFRDESLKHHRLGRGFIRTYYEHGPKLARIISSRTYLRFMSKYMIVKPAYLASLLLSKTKRR